MKCREVQLKLYEYLDGICGDEARRIALHLGECERCHNEYRELRKTIRMVQGVKLPDPGPEFWMEQREKISDGAYAIMRSGYFERVNTFLRLIFPWRSMILSVRQFSPTQHHIAGAVVILIVVITGIIHLGNYTTGSDRYPSGLPYVLVEEDLGEAYVSGGLVRDLSVFEELNDLNNKELRDVLTIMAREYGFTYSSEGEGVLSLESEPNDIDSQIHGLEPDEVIRLMELLEMKLDIGKTKGSIA